jgi:hypothetical protein
MWMQELDIKRGHYKKIDGGRLKEIMENIFGEVNEDGDKLESNYGAMKPITVWIKDKSTLCVEISTSKDVDDKVALDSIKARNKFLEAATGFNSKQRSKRLQEKAKKGGL